MLVFITELPLLPCITNEKVMLLNIITHLINRNSCNMRPILFQEKFLFLQKKIPATQKNDKYLSIDQCILILIKKKIKKKGKEN